MVRRSRQSLSVLRFWLVVRGRVLAWSISNFRLIANSQSKDRCCAPRWERGHCHEHCCDAKGGESMDDILIERLVLEIPADACAG